MLNFQFLRSLSLSLSLSVAALLVGVLLSFYLFVRWLWHRPRPRYLLFWALALFLMFWFQVPLILTSMGRVVTVTDFNFFFAITFPITFLALILVYAGICDILGIHFKPRTNKLFIGWFVFAVLFFSYHFIVNAGIIKTYALPLGGNIFFYPLIRTLIILTLLKWLVRPGVKTAVGVMGAMILVAESVIGLYRNFLVVKTVLAYPPAFWYLAMAELKIFFTLQTVSVILLAAGFFFLHRMYCRTKTGAKDF